MALSMKSIATQRAARVVSGRSSTALRANADRPLFYPGNPAPEWLDGTLPGDYGYDPLGLSSDPKWKKWMVQAELQNARWAMMGVAGMLFVGVANQAGYDIPQWYDAGAVAIEKGRTVWGSKEPIGLGTLLATQLLMMHWVETKRGIDMENPGSQSDGSFLGVTEEFTSTDPGYPGGKYFDPFGMSKSADFEKLKVAEIKNGRLAMFAFVGFLAQQAATGKGPIENLVDHLADPYNVTFATNGVSVPFIN